ncbi:MAG: hypothetical protein K0V04_02695 [Deltaproteobacteria bacterium]|nr:hypothetical protein [Deltaproteobacteria bacterium]
MLQTKTLSVSSMWRALAPVLLATTFGPLACVVDDARPGEQDPRDGCDTWAPNWCGLGGGCFAEPGACEDIFGGPRECTAGNWVPVASCGGGDDGGDGGCQPWSSGRCGLGGGCFADSGTCADVFGGPRVCENGNWTPVASCGGGDDGGDDGGVDAPPLPDYGVGLDPGAMVNAANGQVWFHDPAIQQPGTNDWLDNLDLMEQSGAQYVRVNFIRPVGWSEQAWLDLYDPLIDELLDADLIPYALISAEAVAQPFPAPWLSFQDGQQVATYNAAAQTSWIEDHYAPTFRTVVDHFEGRIQVYESFNEPDNWFLHGQNGLVESPRLRAHTFAEMLDAVYDEVKGDGAHGDVSLVSGPLVGHDHGGFGAAAGYLNSAIDHGQQFLQWGGSTYPFDGVGYHIYVQQGTNNGFGVQGSVAASIDAVHSMLVQELGASQTDLRGELWISEMGWATPGVSEQTQRDALQSSLNYLRGQSWRVRMASWYQVGDTPSEGGFGLIRPHFMNTNDDPTRFKSSWWEFINQAALAD